MSKRRNSGTANDDLSGGSLEGDGNALKYSHIEETALDTKPRQNIICTLPPHNNPPSFSNFEDYELHYRKAHANRCAECHKNFPTAHYLNLHIAENHDPLNEARKARDEKIFACFVEDCEKVCSTAHKRRMHLIDKHFFPKNYDFFIVNDGLKGRRSLLRPNFPNQTNSTASERRKDTAKHETGPEKLSQERESGMRGETSASGSEDDTVATSSIATAAVEDFDVQGITRSMAELKFVPNSVRFGRGRGRGGLARK